MTGGIKPRGYFSPSVEKTTLVSYSSRPEESSVVEYCCTVLKVPPASRNWYHEATRLKRLPLSLDPVEEVDCLFNFVRTGMQWGERQPKTVSHTSVIKHTTFVML